MLLLRFYLLVDTPRQLGIKLCMSLFFGQGRVFSEMPALADRNSILIRDTRLENTIICHPQQRNIHGRIFGGFLMRRAFELAFSTCYVFGGITPLFLEVDHVDFRRPVGTYCLYAHVMGSRCSLCTFVWDMRCEDNNVALVSVLDKLLE
jgi:hypothetical protein